MIRGKEGTGRCCSLCGGAVLFILNCGRGEDRQATWVFIIRVEEHSRGALSKRRSSLPKHIHKMLLFLPFCWDISVMGRVLIQRLHEG